VSRSRKTQRGPATARESGILPPFSQDPGRIRPDALIRQILEVPAPAYVVVSGPIGSGRTWTAGYLQDHGTLLSLAETPPEDPLQWIWLLHQTLAEKVRSAEALVDLVSRQADPRRQTRALLADAGPLLLLLDASGAERKALRTLEQALPEDLPPACRLVLFLDEDPQVHLPSATRFSWAPGVPGYISPAKGLTILEARLGRLESSEMPDGPLGELVALLAASPDPVPSRLPEELPGCSGHFVEWTLDGTALRLRDPARRSDAIPRRPAEPVPGAPRWQVVRDVEPSLSSRAPVDAPGAVMLRRIAEERLAAGDLTGACERAERSVSVLARLLGQTPEVRIELLRALLLRAEIRWRSGQEDEALDDGLWASELENGLAEQGAEPPALEDRVRVTAWLGVLYAAVRQPRLALEHLESARLLFGELRRSGQLALPALQHHVLETLAQVHLESGHLESASEVLEDGLGNLASAPPGGRSRILALRGWSRWCREDLRGARLDCSEALKDCAEACQAGHVHLGPARARLRCDLAWLALDQRADEEARESFRLAAEELLNLVQHESRQDLAFLAARALQELAVLQAAAGNLEEALKVDSQALACLGDARCLEVAICHSNRGTWRMRLGDASGGLADLNRAVELLRSLNSDPRQPDCREHLATAFFNRAGVFRRAGDLVLALRDYDQAATLQEELLSTGAPIRLTEQLAETLANQALTRVQSEGPEAGLAGLTRALERLGEEPAGLRARIAGNRAEFNLRLGRTESALQDLEEAIRLLEGEGSHRKSLVELLCMRASLLQERGEPDLVKAVGLHAPGDPDLAWVLLALSRCREARGDWEAAEVAASEGLAGAGPAHPSFRALFLQRLNLLRLLNRRAEALALTQAALARQSGEQPDPHLLVEHAEVLLATEAFDEALRVARHACETPSGVDLAARARLALAEALEAGGDAPAAAQEYRLAVEALGSLVEEEQRHDLLPWLARAWYGLGSASDAVDAIEEAIQALDWGIDLLEELVRRRKQTVHASLLASARLRRGLLGWPNDALEHLQEACRCFELLAGEGESLEPLLLRLQARASESIPEELRSAVEALLNRAPSSCASLEDELLAWMAEATDCLAREAPEEAIPIYDRLLARWDERPADFRGSALLRERLASTYNNRSALRADRGQHQEAFEDNARALELYQALSRTEGDEELLFGLSQVLSNRAVLYECEGRVGEALQEIESTCQMRREILARTGRLEYRDALVRTLHWRAQLLMEYGEPEAVRRALDEAEEAFSGLMEVQPDPEVVRDLASLLIQRARWREGEEELSVQRFRLSRVMDLRDWLQEAGSDLDEELGSLLAEHAAACAEAGNRDGEVEAAQAALALLEPLVGNRDKEKILTVLEDLRLRCRVSDSRSG